ncbi:MAG: type II secretion system F family protein [Acidobacteriia bacterium]|nr:type II secretion system F family protein [Terriglobia bacterium]
MLSLFTVLTFLVVATVLALILLLAGGAWRGNIIRGRLEAIEKGTSYGKATLNVGLIRDELLSTIPLLNRFLLRWAWSARLRNFIAQAGLRVRPGKLVLMCAVLGALTLEIVQVLYGNLLLSAVLAIPAALSPVGYVALKRLRRLRAFEREFPEVIDLLSRSVRAGHSFTTGLEIVATDLPEPVAGEFRATFDEQRFGLPLRDVLLNLSTRVPLIDVRLFVVALLVQKETGGNLAEILNNLSHVIRERFRIAGEVRVRTAQGRLTAAILIALPLAMLALLRVINPDYVKVLFVDRWGQYMLAMAAGLQVIGAALLWWIVRIKV